MKTLIFIVTILLALTIPAFAADTSIEPAKKTDLDDFGHWLYSQPNTDLDLCVKHQIDAHATAADSTAILAVIIHETVPRRTAWLTKQIAACAISQNKRVVSDEQRLRYASELMRTTIKFLDDTCALMRLAETPSAEIRDWRKQYETAALVVIDKFVIGQIAEAEAQAQADRLRPYLTVDTGLDDAIAQLQTEVGTLRSDQDQLRVDHDELRVDLDAMKESYNSHFHFVVKRKKTGTPQQ